MQPKGRKAKICYDIADCLLGRLLVARTDAGLCAVALGDRDEALVAELRDRFPGAESLQPAPDGLPQEVAAVLGHLEAQVGPEPVSPVSPVSPLPPLDVAGTAFERAVWAAMGQIPAGTSMEYGQFAAMLGYPQGARAVGAAIGKNPLALLFPCHRLVAKGGALHRYRWGLERKARLLAMERAARPGAMRSAGVETAGGRGRAAMDDGVQGLLWQELPANGAERAGAAETLPGRAD